MNSEEPLELQFKGFNFPSTSLISDSNYFLAIYRVKKDPGQPLEFLKFTEIVSDSRNVEFVASVIEPYLATQQICIALFHSINGKDTEEDKHLESNRRKLGEVTFSLKNLAQARNLLSLPLTLPNQQVNGSNGVLEIHGEPVVESLGTIPFQMNYKSEQKSLFQFQPYVYYTISRVNEGNTKNIVFKSDPVKGWEQNWTEVILPLQKLCNVDDQRILLFQFHYGSSSTSTSSTSTTTTISQPFGIFETCLEEMIENSEKKKSIKVFSTSSKDQIVGTVTMNCGKIIKSPIFAEYWAASDVKLVVGIDLTGSNGDPKVPGSLHYVEEGHQNAYEQVLSIGGAIMGKVCKDQEFILKGYGAKSRDNGPVCHCIDIADHAEGVDGALHAYRAAIPHQILSGPTCFAPIIRYATHLAIEREATNPLIASTPMKDLKYTILFMLTDGDIVDIDDTKAAIVEASKAPLSIIIVGIGNQVHADQFQQMRMLDSDGKLLQYKGTVAERDIVQFVPFNASMELGEDHFAQDLQAELAEQVLAYYGARNIIV